ncbi:putative NAD-dependent aldehyde dehydrogenase; coniferyl aldehyde dehydrogenase (CALDH) [Bradyrhizobium sp. ORS 285]|uniref:coniferyl aldehyde dehydrogenase n=1 Tax=Bradyrhizobium sp. ORS 285 TaxID=115808 RepID=UPI000240ABB7|nr:coniferyl aldehyde dehydrogenase [Bradyrhizobium sp. ORS 285]CCD87042.1 putative NAD-dependent aldehyde dehydrogenase; coniferyl aldehyde dehydrogenase (CALDH) [Bradyrhizobium sp. ORS 285]SMX61058.1 putative NAD-dependent aldehyde dehydrogenase; coniferyl aldehyde dehydrogenase (CALDH) [Bradyrhizobium sp. ORS 285]
MDHSLKSPPVTALDDTFHAMIEASRGTSPPDLAARQDSLRRLRGMLADNERRLEQAISADFGHRCAFETTIAETLFLQTELKHTLKMLPRWMAPRRIATSLQFFPARNRLIPQPLGVVGIIAPWNYPLQLTLAPAIGAIAAGNRVLIKPSELTPHFSALLRELIAAAFDPIELSVTGIEDGVAQAFAALPFDHLVFTGSTRVGRIVAEAAGRNLTPVTLELGGKSPTIVDVSADIDEAAERIAYAKLLNAGQTCIAPDYVFVPEARRDAFAGRLHGHMLRMFGTNPANGDYTSIISDRHYQRLEGLLRDAIARGAKPLSVTSPEDPAWKKLRKFPPTVVVGATAEMAIMQEEIFGPLLPVLTYRDAHEVIRFINAHDRPLALYWFGKDETARENVLARTLSGGVTINDCLLHFAQMNQPMGGVGASGIGHYHGEWGFDSFSKLKPVFYRSPFNRMKDLYPPYGASIAWIEKLLRFLS